ncbi:glutathione S-transferase [Dactylonectria macrodidyma]|uniref:Glutathione S-transferase n=1 Tax=Dactylonectria macrodidyma TaxID=307937 RepID=A0A9P9IJL6_9HYPO|nr:glutathione S-transferase [Dactylonectria macrodidyma]
MAPIGTLHAVPINPRIRKIIATAAIAGVELSISPDFKFGESNKHPSFLSKFPLGKIPTFETVDGFNLSESYAIASYVADRAPTSKQEQLLGSTPEERSLVQQWIFFTSLHIDPTVGKLCAWRKGFAEYDEEVERLSAAEMKRWMDYMETSIKGKRWFVKSEGGPSLADVAIGSVMYFAFAAYLDKSMRREYPEVTGWYVRLRGAKEIAGLFEGDMVESRVERAEGR